MNFQTLIQPENETEQKIISNPAWQEGVLWGMAREGHPEGKVIYHVQEVLKNIDRLKLNPDDRTKLRFVALIHDTFKNKIDITKPRIGDNSHAILARKFAELYTEDQDVLNIIEYHDTAYRAWRYGEQSSKWEKARIKLTNLTEHIGKAMNLYYLFYKCDNETGNKDTACIKWFEKILGN